MPQLLYITLVLKQLQFLVTIMVCNAIRAILLVRKGDIKADLKPADTQETFSIFKPFIQILSVYGPDLIYNFKFLGFFYPPDIG